MLLLLAGCSAASPPAFPPCPPPVAVPANPPRIRTAERIGQFAVALELARESERARADRCADAVSAMSRWIEGKR